MARSTTLIALGALIAAAMPAAAADLGLPPPPVMEEGPGLSELGTGWYLRGDLGYVRFDEPKEERFNILRPVLGEDRVEETFSAGFGIGYKFLSVFRADVTADYRFDHGLERHFYRRPDEGGPLERVGIRTREGFESTTILANGYLDLGTWHGITPYIGGGLGYAQNRYFAHFRPLNIPGPKRYLNVPEHTANNLAWSLTGGAAVEIGHGFSVDVNYRYVNLGPAHSDIVRLNLAQAKDDLESHEARVGLRYMID